MLNYVYRWWKDLNFSRELPFIRDRLVECYFWILGVYFEPEYLLARSMLTKVIAMTSVLDDIYDVYGTFEELELFTDAIERLTSTHFLILIPFVILLGKVNSQESTHFTGGTLVP